MGVCNICQNDQFKAGPYERLSPGGDPPLCTKCSSLERHRIYRSIFNRIRDRSFKTGTCLQFSLDPSIARGWFGNHELSAYGGPNTLDIQHIDRGNATYDVVVCNHVLEHVADYRAAISELVRITTPEGFLFLSIPNPHRRAVTDDWGYPKPEQHGHYRIFGRDIERAFAEVVPHVHVIAIEDVDPVTGVSDSAYILTRSDRWLARIFEQGCKARICQARRENGARGQQRVLHYREQSIAARQAPSESQNWFLIGFRNLGRYASRYSVMAVSDSFDDFCWLELDDTIDPAKDLGVSGLTIDASGQIYLAVQSSEPRLVQLDGELRVVRSVPVRGEPRSLAVEGTTVYLASPAENSVYAIDMAEPAAAMREVASLHDEAGEPVFPSGIALGPDGVVACVSKQHASGSVENPLGFVIEAKSGRVLVSDAHEPHNVAMQDGVLHVLASGSGEYLRKRGDGPCRRHFLGGYLSGLCVTDEQILIGRSSISPGTPAASARKNQSEAATARSERRQRPAMLVISPATGAMNAIDLSLYGSEISGILRLPPGRAPSQIVADPVHRRMASLQEAQLRLAEEVAALRCGMAQIAA